MLGTSACSTFQGNVQKEERRLLPAKVAIVFQSQCIQQMLAKGAAGMDERPFKGIYMCVADRKSQSLMCYDGQTRVT